MAHGLEERALAALDPARLVADAAELVRIPSVTGDERAAAERLAERAGDLGLQARLAEHQLAALRADPEHPGEEADRSELVGLTLVAAGRDPAGPRLCLNGHLDVVEPGDGWSEDPFSGEVADGYLYGRGSADMKGGLVAAVHAAAAIAAAGGARGDVVVHAVSSEEDGGLGTFAALREDADFAGCVIPEPTGFDVACAQAGALTFTGTVPGVAAHAATRLEGVSAIDRYLPVHAALREHEREVNRDVPHPLMRELELPYPIEVGRLQAGSWSSSVPDRLVFEGRAGVAVDEPVDEAMARVERVVRGACPEAGLRWAGGRFASAETPVDAPLARLVLAATGEELGRPARAVGVPYGADMRLYAARGIPCVMVGPGGIERAHAADERVRVADLERLARLLVRVAARFGA